MDFTARTLQQITGGIGIDLLLSRPDGTVVKHNISILTSGNR